MKDLTRQIDQLKKSEVGVLVEKRIKEFETLGRKSPFEIFSELCFCLLTANFNAKRAIVIQKKVGGGFATLSEIKLAKKLKTLGYRFPNTRAAYIVEARKHKRELKKTLSSFEDELELRDYIAKSVKGLGYKEASHFMRNIGYKNVAIIDFHIADLLEHEKIIEKPKTLGKKNYLEIENQLRIIARKTKLDLARLDLYLWFMETGTVLK